MRLREYSRNDLPEVLSLFYETVHALGSPAFTPEQLDAWAPAVPDEASWQERLAFSSSFVAEHKDRLVGFGNVTALGLIDTLYVHQNAQKTGVGGALLMRLTAEAKSNGLRTVQTEANLAARPFFEKQGFRLTRENTKVVRGVEFRTYVMTMDITEDEASED